MTVQRTCRGSLVLGTACRRCARCEREADQVFACLREPPAPVSRVQAPPLDPRWDVA